MTRNTAYPGAASGAGWAGPTIALVGLMGAGKSAIGRRLAARLGLGFRDADSEIEAAAGCSVAEMFERWGEAAFRQGERQVIRRLLAGPPVVLATGGGAYIDAGTREVLRERAVTVWLRAPLPVLVRRTAGRLHRPLLQAGDPEAVLAELMARRYPVYAEADLIVDTGEDSAEATTERVMAALASWHAPHRVRVALDQLYEVVIGEGLLPLAGSLIAPVVPRREAIVVADSSVAALHGGALAAGLERAGFAQRRIEVPPGEGTKSLAEYGRLVEAILAAGVERGTALIALGGGVVGDLVGFAAATVLRGLPFVQVPTTLLAQVDSSVGGKTGINLAAGKNLLGAFHHPRVVIADTAVLATLPARERRAGYAEIVKAGLIGDASLFGWCEANGEALLAGDGRLAAEAVRRAVAFKAAVVAEDEREEAASGGRALLNLGHTFGHALEAAFGYSGALLHGEAVAVGLGLAARLSEALGVCPAGLAARIEAHLARVGLPARLADLGRALDPEALLASMRRDKKVRNGRLRFVLLRGAGEAFTADDVPEAAVRALLAAGPSGNSPT